jgi:predicted nucleic-acid-binding protein
METRTIDTNILVRLLVKDDGEQWKQAAKLAAGFFLVVLPTVALETEWVLRSRFGFDRKLIAKLFTGLMASESITFIDSQRVARALDCFELGMGFADAMHVSFTGDGETFVTFDRDLVRHAQKQIHHTSVELAS